MGVVRINDKLKEEVMNYISQENNQYNYPNISIFVNSAIFEKLRKVKGGSDGELVEAQR